MTVELEITTLTNGGDGLGRVDGKAVFVAATVPGDVVRCALSVIKKNYAKGRLLQVLQPSSERVQPVCPYFADCGGCDWQMLSYRDQCAWKEHLLWQNCAHQLKVEEESVSLPLVSSDEQTGYRSRIQLKCGHDAGGFKVGFYRRSSHCVVDIDSCPVVDQRINSLLQPLRELFTGCRFANQVGQVDVAVGDGGLPRMVVHYSGRQLHPFCSWLRAALQSWRCACFVRSDDNRLHHIQGEGDIQIMVDNPDLTLAYAPGGFAQINLGQNRKLVDMVVRATEVDKKSSVLDLYCGMGNFSLPLSRRARQVVGVEGYADSIKYAKSNAAANSLTNVQFHRAKVVDFIAALENEGSPFDIVVLDPPRAGAKDVMNHLVAQRVRRVVYVSCDQHTLLRDLKVLLAGGYRLISIQPLDMFPQTAHTEVVAVLETG